MKQLALALSILMITGCAQATQYQVQPQPVAQPEPYLDFSLPDNMPKLRGSKIKSFLRNEKLTIKAANMYSQLETPVKQWICRYDKAGVTELYHFKFMEMLNDHPTYAVRIYKQFDDGDEGDSYAFGILIEDQKQISLMTTWEDDNVYNQRARHIRTHNWEGVFSMEWQDKTDNSVQDYNSMGRCAFKNVLNT